MGHFGTSWRVYTLPKTLQSDPAWSPAGSGALSDAENAYLLDQRNLLLFFGDYILRQRSVAQRLRVLLAVFQHPMQECDDRLLLALVFDLRWYQQPGEGGDGVSLFPRRIGDGDPEVRGYVLGGGGRLGNAFQVRFQVGPGGVAHESVRHFVLQRVDQLDVADRVGGLLDHARHTFVALSAYAARPAHRSTCTHLGLPFRADLGEVVGKDEASAAAAGPMDHNDLRIGQFHAWIRLSQFRIVPLLDVAQIDSRQRFGRELQILRDARDVIGGHDSAKHGRKMQGFAFELAELLVSHRHVRSAEIYSAIGEHPDAAAGAHRLVVDLRVGIGFTEFFEPLAVDRIRKRGAGRVDQHLGLGHHQQDGERGTGAQPQTALLHFRTPFRFAQRYGWGGRAPRRRRAGSGEPAQASSSARVPLDPLFAVATGRRGRRPRTRGPPRGPPYGIVGLVVWRLSRQGVPQVHENQVVVSVPWRARRHIPRIAEQVRVLEDEAQRSVVRILPERLVETERAFLDGPVLAVGGFRIAVADKRVLGSRADSHIPADVVATVVGEEQRVMGGVLETIKGG